MDASAIISRYDEGVVELRMLQSQKQERVKAMEAHTLRLSSLEQAHVVILETAKRTQDILKFRIQELAQSSIDTIFPGKYALRVDFNDKRDATECDIYLEEGGQRLDPKEQNGGGLVDVIAFALRIAAWSIGKTRPTIIMDEPLKFLSAKYKPMLAEILQKMSHELNLQLIIITHDEEMINVADRVFLVDQYGKKSSVKQLDLGGGM